MWADQFVGLPYRKMGRDIRGLDCYGLVRLVLKKIANQDWPLYCDEDPDGKTIVKIAEELNNISFDQARALDVAIINQSVKERGIWVFRPIHMGIFLDSKRILHIEADSLSRVQMTKELNLHSILRVT